MLSFAFLIGVENGSGRQLSALCAFRTVHKRAASAGARTSSTLELGRVYPRGPGSLWLYNQQLQMSPPHSTDREMKTSEDEGSVRPGFVNLRWSHIREGSGEKQTPLDLDSTSSWVLFGRPD